MPFEDGNFEASECCRICQDYYPETKAWSIQSGHRSCNCIIFVKTLTQKLMKKKPQIRVLATARQNVGVLDPLNDDWQISQRLQKMGFFIIQDYLTSV